MKNLILVCFAKEMPSIERKRTTKKAEAIELIKKRRPQITLMYWTIDPLQLQPKFHTLFIYVAQGPGAQWCASEIHTGFSLTQLLHL
jgi:hypothetical protein